MTYRIAILLLFLITLSSSIAASAMSDDVLMADFRHRPPEMLINDGVLTGPLKDILDEAAHQLGYRVKWRQIPFARSLRMLRNGETDIVPRTIHTLDREAYINYLGPIGHQIKNIVFVVKKGQESRLTNYQDLTGLKIGVKRKTAYFPRFNQDKALHKEEQLDDDNMVRMFEKGRFDVMAVLDKAALESAMLKHNIHDFSYAKYQFKQVIGNYYGMSQTSKNAALYSDLNRVLQEMLALGRIKEIYLNYGLEAPLQMK